MPVPLYMDGHVPHSITDQLRFRGVDVITAIEDGARELSDKGLLERARTLGRVIFTQDIGFKALAEQWQRQGRPFSGLLFGHQMGGTIGEFVKDLELIARASDMDDWRDTIQYVPL